MSIIVRACALGYDMPALQASMMMTYLNNNYAHRMTLKHP